MTEKKPLSPLLLFCLSSVLSFSTGVFTGVILVPHFEKPSNSLETNEIKSWEEETVEHSNENLNIEEQEIQKKENKTLTRYKDMLKKSIDESSHNEEFFKNYGVFIGSYANMDKANSTAIDLKSQYNWETAVYPMDNFYKVIIGPFNNQESAQKFLDQMPKISRFIPAKIIEFPSQ